jgi:hypothetical protein
MIPFCTRHLLEVLGAHSRGWHFAWQAASFGGSNIDPTAWEDKKCRGESRFPAQVASQSKLEVKSFLKNIVFGNQ